jgi:hypothetical protein
MSGIPAKLRWQSLTANDVWKVVFSVGGGVKFRLRQQILLRAEFRDYLTTFPRQQIVPALHNTARGVFEQFTPLFGVSYTCPRRSTKIRSLRSTCYSGHSVWSLAGWKLPRHAWVRCVAYALRRRAVTPLMPEAESERFRRVTCRPQERPCLRRDRRRQLG